MCKKKKIHDQLFKKDQISYLQKSNISNVNCSDDDDNLPVQENIKLKNAIIFITPIYNNIECI